MERNQNSPPLGTNHDSDCHGIFFADQLAPLKDKLRTEIPVGCTFNVVVAKHFKMR